MTSRNRRNDSDFPWGKAIGMYLVSIAMLGIYWYLHYREIFTSVRSASSELDPDEGLKVVAVGGMIEYGLLIGGLTIFAVVTLMALTRSRS